MTRVPAKAGVGHAEMVLAHSEVPADSVIKV